MGTTALTALETGAGRTGQAGAPKDPPTPQTNPTVVADASNVPSANLPQALTTFPDLFEDAAPLSLVIEGPLETAFRAAHAGQPDPPFFNPNWKREKENHDGFAAVDEGAQTKLLPAQVKVRGDLSLAECKFPKVTLDFDDHAPGYDTSTFAASERLKVGTHCQDVAGNTDQVTTQGRLLGEKAPYRENLAWELYQLLEPQYALRARPAVIRWRDTSDVPPGDTSGSAVHEQTRKAFVFEHPRTAASRLGLPDYVRTVDGTERDNPVLTEEELEKLDVRTLDPERVRRILMFQALIGNWDFSVSSSTSESPKGPIRNTEVLVAPEQNGQRELVPVPIDFDRASLVNGKYRPDGRPASTPRPGDLEKQTETYLTHYLKGYRRADVLATKKEFVARKADFERLVEQAQVDDRGRELAKAHLAAFFTVVARLYKD